MNRLACVLSIVAASAAASCSSTPANVAGSYSISVTDEASGCPLSNWNQGSSTANIPVVISQDNDSATAQVTGLTGTYLNAVLGSNTFSGSVDGDDLALTLFGTVSQTMSNCTYTYEAKLDGTLSGDTVSGTIVYEAQTPTGDPNCASAMITGCMSTQNFNGTRPPT